MNKQQIEWIEEKAKTNKFFNSLKEQYERKGSLSQKQIDCIVRGMNKENARNESNYINLTLTTTKNNNTEYITVQVFITSISEITFEDKYNWNYRGWGSRNMATKKVYQGVSKNTDISFWENKHTSNIEMNKCYEIKARVKKRENGNIEINYIKEVNEINIELERPSMLFPEEYLAF